MPRRPRRLRRRAGRLRRAGPPRTAAICLAGNHDLAVVDVLSLEEFSRGAALAATLDARRDPARDARVPALAQARGQRARASGSSTPPRATRSGSTCSPALTAELCFDATDFRVSLIGHSHVALSFHRPEGEPATGHDPPRGHRARPRDGRVADQPRLDRPAARRRPARRLAAARHRRAGRRPGGARSTTSRARRPRSARPTCPTRSPSASSTGSKAVGGSGARAASLRRRMPRRPLLALGLLLAAIPWPAADRRTPS